MRIWRSINRALVYLAVVMLIFASVEIAAKYQVDFAVPRSPPTEVGLSQLTWIRTHYGYDNRSVIIVVRDTSSYLWALAYNSGLIYFGNIFYLLTNQTDPSLLNSSDSAVRSDYIGSIQKLWVYRALETRGLDSKTILIPSTLYRPDVIEYQALTPFGNGVLSVKRPMDMPRIQELFKSWSLARSSNDYFMQAADYIQITPITDCADYQNWKSNSSSILPISGSNFTDGSSCSLRVNSKPSEDLTVLVSLSSTKGWNLSIETYVGFYFMGTHDSMEDNSLTIYFGGMIQGSYFAYTLTSKSLWTGQVQGVVIPLSLFQSFGNPTWSSISVVGFGVRTVQGGFAQYGLQYVATAHDL